VSNRLAPAGKAWAASLVIVGRKQAVDGKPKGTARFRVQGRAVRPGNALAKRIAKGCR
jgi:hypothetical protein